MPAFNVADFLETAVRSALNQTLPPHEIVIVDDGSTDGTGDLASRLAVQAPDVIKVIHQANKGLSGARNTAIQAASGDLLALLDSDDIWAPSFLFEQLRLFETDPRIDVVTGNGRFLGGPRDGDTVRPHPDRRPHPTLKHIIADEEAIFIMSVFRTSLFQRVGPFNPAYRTNEDYDFWLRAALAGCVFARNSTPLSYYRVRSGSLSSNQVVMLKGILAVYRNFRPLLVPGSEEQVALDRQVARFEAELYSASVRHRVELPPRRSVTAFLLSAVKHRVPPRIALTGALARSAPRLFQIARRLTGGGRAVATQLTGPSSTGDLDRAGKDYWEQLWEHVDFAPDIDPQNKSIWAYRDHQFHRYFQAHLADFGTGFSVLELGCARSAWLPYFARQFSSRICGLDYAEVGAQQTADRLRKLGIPADVRCADLFNPPADWVEAFDVVTWFGVAEHFEDTAAVIRAASRYLKPGGIMLTEIPNMTGPIGVMQRLFNRPVYELHVPLTKPQLTAGHARAGLEVVAASYLVPTDFGVVNLEGAPPSPIGWLREKLLYGLRLLTGCIWWLDRRFGPVPLGRLTSGFIVVAARKPIATDLAPSVAVDATVQFLPRGLEQKVSAG